MSYPASAAVRVLRVSLLLALFLSCSAILSSGNQNQGDPANNIRVDMSDATRVGVNQLLRGVSSSTPRRQNMRQRDMREFLMGWAGGAAGINAEWHENLEAGSTTVSDQAALDICRTALDFVRTYYCHTNARRSQRECAFFPTIVPTDGAAGPGRYTEMETVSYFVGTDIVTRSSATRNLFSREDRESYHAEDVGFLTGNLGQRRLTGANWQVLYVLTQQPTAWLQGVLTLFFDGSPSNPARSLFTFGLGKVRPNSEAPTILWQHFSPPNVD